MQCISEMHFRNALQNFKFWNISKFEIFKCTAFSKWFWKSDFENDFGDKNAICMCINLIYAHALQG